MARFREHSYQQSRFIPVSFSEQIQPGTIEYLINYLVDHEIDLSVFHKRFRNDETGAPAFDPAVLLKIVLFGYSGVIISSRKIAQCCEENVVFMALSADSHPHYTTIADLIWSMDEEVVKVFTDVLTVCNAEGLVGKRMFAIDGCKLAANCAKERSGRKAELVKKAEKIEQAIGEVVKRHRDGDGGTGESGGTAEAEGQRIQKLQGKAKKIRSWLAEHEERMGEQGKPIKSNITDADSVKMPSAHGVIQGYNGLATVDEKHQIIVAAQAFGQGTEAGQLKGIVEGIRAEFEQLQPGAAIYREVVLTADSGFDSEASVRGLTEQGIEAYVADRKFRKRDKRFEQAQEHKNRTVDGKPRLKKKKHFSADEFVFEPNTGALVCPAGKEMKRRTPNFRNRARGYSGVGYIGKAVECVACRMRQQCIRNPEVTKVRQVAKLQKEHDEQKRSYTERMIEGFESVRGQAFYRRRMGTVEPVFANIRSTLGLNRFTLRGSRKVNIQWQLYCIVHNIGKLCRYAM